MIIEDLQEFIKLNNIDSETEEYTSDDKVSRLQGKVSPSKGNKHTPKNGHHKTSESADSYFDFSFDFPKKH